MKSFSVRNCLHINQFNPTKNSGVHAWSTPVHKWISANDHRSRVSAVDMFSILLLLVVVSCITQLQPPLHESGATSRPVPSAQQQHDDSESATPALPRQSQDGLTRPLPLGVSASWWTQSKAFLVRNHFGLQRMETSPLPGNIPAWWVPGQQRGYQTYLTENGLHIISTRDNRHSSAKTAPSWSLQLQLMHDTTADPAIDSTSLPNGSMVSTSGNRLEYQHSEFVTEWFVNQPQGLEHGFTLRATPQSRAKTTELHLAIRGNTRQHMDTQGNIHFLSPAGDEVLAYKNLHAFDAAGQTLATAMRLERGYIVLRVDTQTAHFPVTIDPLITDPAVEDACKSINIVWCKQSSGVDNYGLGWSVSSAGDINQDGFADVLVSDPMFSNPPGVITAPPNLGRVYVFHGSATGLQTIPAVIITPPADVSNRATDTGFGYSVAGAGDVNNDTIDDIIVGAPWYDDYSVSVGESDEGGVFVYYGTGGGAGAPGLKTTPGLFIADGGPNIPVTDAYDWLTVSDQASAFLGQNVTAAGDVNGDGIGDILIGEPFRDSNGFINAGAVHAYYGSANGLALLNPGDPAKIAAAPNWSLLSYIDSAQLGDVTARAGDVNGDGFSDVVFGISNADVSFPNCNPGCVAPCDVNICLSGGKSLLFYGSAFGLSSTPAVAGADFNYVPDWSTQGTANLGYYGHSVASAGDVNADGFADVIVGAILENPTQINEGAAYIYHGSNAGLSLTPSVPVLYPGVAGAHFGWSVAGAGDVNADGYSDIIVGAMLYTNPNTSNPPVDETDEGAVFLYQGSAAGIQDFDLSGNPIPASHVPPILEGNSPFARFGGWVAPAGDVNGDGYSDILIGAEGYNTTGAALMYRGAGKSDLIVTVTPTGLDTNGNALPGTPLSFAMNIFNAGPDPARALNIRVALPAHTDIASLDLSAVPVAWDCAFNAVTFEVECPAGLTGSLSNIHIAANATQTFSIGFQTTWGQDSAVFSSSGPSIIDLDATTNSQSINITGNTPPTGGLMAVTTLEDQAIINQAFQVSDADLAAGDSHTFSIVTGAAHGMVTNNFDGTFNYQPDLNWDQPDGFEYEVVDTFGASARQLVDISITPVNDPPVADAYSFSITPGPGSVYNADGVSNPKLSGSDVETGANLLAFSQATITLLSGNSVSMPGDGTFVFSADNIATGSEAFTFTVTDDDPVNPLTSTATVTVNYLGVANLPPQAFAPVPDPFVILEDSSIVNGQLNATDDSGITAYIVDNSATLGTLTHDTLSGIFNYTPPANYNGMDSFTFYVTDNATPPVSSNVVTYRIQIDPVNDPPTAAPVSFAVNEDSKAADNPPQPLLGNDIDNGAGALLYSIGTGADGPQLGGATLISGNSIQYVPNANVFGTDTFTYTVSDAQSATAAATVTVTINPVNDPPVITTDPLNLSGAEDTAVSVSLAATDPDTQDTLSYAIVTGPLHGTIPADISNGQFSYQPGPNFNGADSFSYTVSDNGTPVLSVQGSVNLTIKAQNDPPTADPVELTIAEDSAAVTLILKGNDVDLNDTGSTEALQYSATTGATPLGTIKSVNATAGSLVYQPLADKNGIDSFNYTVRDNAGITASAAINITISPVNDAPYFDPIPTQTAFVNSTTEIDLSAFAKDIDSTNLVFLPPDTSNTQGSVTLAPGGDTSGVFLYTPVADSRAPDQFTVSISDGDASPVSSTVSVNLILQQKAPVALDGKLTLAEDNSAKGNLAAVDIDGQQDIQQFIIATAPVHGTLTEFNNATGAFTYQPEADFNGEDTIEFTAQDFSGQTSNTGRFTLTVEAVNDAPVIAADISQGVNENGGQFIVSASDIDGDLLTIELNPDLPASLGTVTIAETGADNTAQISYTPKGGKFGSDAFGIRVIEKNAGANDAYVYSVVHVSITKLGAQPPSQPTLLYPLDESTQIATDVDFEWTRAKVAGQDADSLRYQIMYCDKAGLTDCISGETVPVPSTLTNLSALLKASTLPALGGTGAGLFVLGLLGGSSRRRRLYQAIVVASLTLTLFACNQAANEVTYTPLDNTDTQSSIKFQVAGLQNNTEYFWRVIVTDDASGISSSSNIHRFTTAP